MLLMQCQSRVDQHYQCWVAGRSADSRNGRAWPGDIVAPSSRELQYGAAAKVTGQGPNIL